MTRKSVFVTRRWPDAVEARISEHFEPVFNDSDRPLDQSSLRDALKNCDALLPTVTDKLDAAVFEDDPKAKIICNYGVGYSHIDVEAAKEKGIVVTNTPDVLSECTADIAMTLLLMAARRAGEGERELRSGQWTGWRPTHLVGQKVSGKTLGIIGFGRIGRETAKRAKFGFGMNILVQNRSQIDAEILAKYSAKQVDMGQILAESDFISLHCPGGAENRHLIDKEKLRRMRRSAFLINTARGEVVDEIALAEALNSGVLAGAGLDVFDGEPEVRKELLECRNVVLLPHLGSATAETREAMGHRAVDNMIAFFEGKDPPDRVV